ncbi:MAG: PaeR7I family type II restriction endonuclease [Nitrospiraceae bacterium]
MKDLEQVLAAAIRQFWKTRQRQEKQQGAASGRRDQGGRSAVTGGAQMDGFIKLVKDLLIKSGIPATSIFRKQDIELPGFFRPTKEWDILVVLKGRLLASIEFKSQVGPSFGNNYNNRTEEALGSATDLWTAYREGAFRESPRPWLGYFMLLEEAPRSTSPVSVSEPHFRVFEEFRNASYARRYELFCQKLVRERLYDAACFLLSDKVGGPKGKFREPSPGLSFRNFAASLTGQAMAYAKF